METRKLQAKQNFESGYNCAQSVFLTYAKDFGIDDDMALKLSSSFGGGMGRLREVCGAVSAIFMLAGLKYGYTDNKNDELKAKHYELIQCMAKKFKKRNGTIICRELLGLDGEDNPIPSKRTAQYYLERPCEKFIQDACEIFESVGGI